MARAEAVKVFLEAWADYEGILETAAQKSRQDLPSDPAQLTRVQRIASDLQSPDWRRTVAMQLAMLEGIREAGIFGEPMGGGDPSSRRIANSRAP